MGMMLGVQVFDSSLQRSNRPQSELVLHLGMEQKPFLHYWPGLQLTEAMTQGLRSQKELTQMRSP